MRFDDRLATVLRFDPGSSQGRAAIWRQMIDMLAQSGDSMSEAAVARGLTALSMLRDQVPLDVRITSSQSVAARCRSTALAVFLSHDVSPVAAGFIDRLTLDESDWLAILPEIGPLGRSRLRRRTDISPAVTRALEAFGSTDFTLAGPLAAPSTVAATEPLAAIEPVAPMPVAAPTEAPSNIASLVQRIEAYRSNRPAPDLTMADGTLAPDALAHDDSISFRTDAEGHIRAVSGVQRSAYVGLCLSETARAAESGFDAGVARAFGKRAPIRSGRLWLTGEGIQSGHWLFDADPKFDRLTGRFQGYVGALRRPMAELGDALPTAMAQSDGDQWQHATVANTPQPQRVAEGMRQMVHELRSPLNAINGFAELIEGQFFGPVSQQYRQLARAIIGDASQLAGTFEDFDVAARLDMGTVTAEIGQSDMAGSVHSALTQLSSYLAASGSSIAIDGFQPLTIAMPEGDARRIVTRFISAVIHHQGDDARLVGRVVTDEHQTFASLVLDAPANGHESASDADNDDGEPGEVIGLDFSLRLVDRLARIYGGSLDRLADQFILNLPLLSSASDRIGTAV